MRVFIHIALVVMLSGCAGSFRPVYTSPEGDYYLEESSAGDSYYGAGSVLYADIGFHPWWIDPYNPLQYVYYSPYFYPHYFSVFYPPVYSPFYRHFGYYYPGYYPNWCPPYLARRNRESSPVEAPIVNGRLVSRGDIWRTQDNQSLNRMVKSGNGTAYKSYGASRSIPSVRSAPAKPATSYQAMGISRSATSTSSRAPRATSSRRSRSASGVSPSRSKQ